MVRPWRSGWCTPGNPSGSHRRCLDHPRRDGVACVCECHVVDIEVIEASPPTLVTEQAGLVAVDYLSPEWYAARRNSVAASEVAAILGLSPYTSAFDLWWTKRTGEQSEGENRDMRRGRRYEALVLEDFAEDHPEFRVAPSVTVRNLERPWQVATPDGLVYEAGTLPANVSLLAAAGQEPVAVIEAKSGANRSEWGEPGTDDIPVHYRCQVLWQMDTLGLNVAYVPVVFGFEFREYVVTYDEADVKILREAAEEFLTSVREDRMPDVDAHTATARRLKKLHPSIEPGEVEIPPAVIAQYHAAKRLRDAAEARMRLAENRVRATLGPRNVATVDGRKVASRSVYDVAERTQTVRGFTVNRLHFSKAKESRGTIR